MATKLKNIKITKVALCPEGACSVADITLFKSKNAEGGKEMSFEEILKQLTPEAQAVVQGEIAKAKEIVPEATATELQKAKNDLATAQTDLAAANTELEKVKATQEGSEEDLLKSVDPAVRALFEKQKLIAKAAEEQINKMKEAQEETLAKTRAAATAGLGIPEAEAVSMFKSLNSKDSELCKQVCGILEKAAKAVTATEVFKATGTDGDQGGEDAYSKLEKKAEEIAKAQNISLAKAMGVAMDQNPELYQAYIDQQVEE